MDPSNVAWWRTPVDYWGCSQCNAFLSALEQRSILHSWKLFGVWRRVEVPCRAPPLTLRLVRSLAAFEIDQGNMEMATLLLLAFHCLLRTGEILALKPTDFLLNDDQGIVSLQQSKSGVRNRAKEAVSITDTLVLDCLHELLKFRRQFNLMQLPLWSSTGSHFRARFAWLCEYFHLQQFHFRPYSLRRGGATKVFQDTGSMETALLRGRWESRRVAKIYICDALSFLPAIKLSAESQSRLRQYYFFSPSTGWPVPARTCSVTLGCVEWGAEILSFRALSILSVLASSMKQ